MTAQSIEAKLETAAEGLVFADPGNLQGLAALHTLFQEAAAWGTAQGMGRFAAAADSAADSLERIILGDASDPSETLGEIGAICAALQEVARDGRSEDAVSFPTDRLSGSGAGAPESPGAAAEEPNGGSRAESDRVLDGDPELLADFVTEAGEHLDSADQHLLTLEATPGDSEALDSVFRAFHTIKGVAGFVGLPEVQSVAHEAENLFDRARKKELVLAGQSMDASFEAVDCLKTLIAEVRAALESGDAMRIPPGIEPILVRIQEAQTGGAPTGEPVQKLGEILTEQGAVPVEDLDAALQRQRESRDGKRLGELLVAEGQAAPEEIQQALDTQTRQRQASQEVKEYIKVDADRLDRLIDYLGELVICEAMVSQAPEVRNNLSPELGRRVSELDKITRELQELGMSLRMIPVRATFQRMARLARDLSKKSGKEVEFTMKGEDTELDRHVVDKIADPLIHMIRNAVDHGLEATEEDRRAAGKPEKGHVELRAFHQGGNIHIEIQDDGRGLDRDVILAKARERGLVSDGSSLSDGEVFELIFEAGFSTAKAITDVSGRGVGMDVVRRNIEALRGNVEITSQLGKGTCFSIRLPLTLAIIDGMTVRVGSDRYIVPTLAVVRAVQPEASQLNAVLGKGEILSVQGVSLPLIRMHRLFNVQDGETKPERALAVVVEEGEQRAALLVDELLGQQQIVIKSLGESFSGLPGVSGGGIMSDGKVALIVDVASLIRAAIGARPAA